MLDFLVLHRVAVLRGDDDRVDAFDVRAVVLKRDLRLQSGRSQETFLALRSLVRRSPSACA